MQLFQGGPVFEFLTGLLSSPLSKENGPLAGGSIPKKKTEPGIFCVHIMSPDPKICKLNNLPSRDQ